MKDEAARGTRSAGGNRDEAGHIKALLHRGAALKLALAEQPAPILAVVDACEAAIRSGNKLLFCGNGGSAADAQHLATELLIRLRGSVVRESWPALALTLDPAMLTAAGNDFGYDQVFARPLSGLGRAGDVLFGITTSGRSPSVLRALEVARGMGIVTVGLLGGDGGPARPLCDHMLIVPDSETARVQECHIALGHIVLELLEDRLTGRRA
ncbi:SIS domain-containing protein [Acidiphilium sp. AL]|nr:SIS domain-containing protein [Acidiphilium sp. AL]